MTDTDISGFLLTIEEKKRQDFYHLISLFSKITGESPVMWGKIVGFGHLRYEYDSGRTGQTPLLGLAMRREGMTLYICNDVTRFSSLSRLGKYKHGKGCLYVNKLSDIDMDVLKELVQEAIADTLALPFYDNDERP